MRKDNKQIVVSNCIDTKQKTETIKSKKSWGIRNQEYLLKQLEVNR